MKHRQLQAAFCSLAMAMVASAADAAAPAQKCRLEKVAEIPLDLRTGVIEASINGRPTHMMVDTGAASSVIFRAAAQALGLDVAGTSQKVYGAGGSDYEGRVTLKDFGLAGFVVHNLTLGAIGRNLGSADYAGVLGQDFLSHWDLEFDPGAKVLRLISPQHCDGDAVVYWAPAYAFVNISSGWGNHLGADVKLNGRDARAWFDTGAWSTVVDAALARRPGYQPTSESSVESTSRGITGASMTVHSAVFASITVGQETIQNPQLRVAELFARDKEVRLGSLLPSKIGDTVNTQLPDMLIGRDFFRAHRVYVARSQDKLYFTYLGGPIFEIKPPTAAPADAAAAPSPVGSTTDPGSATGDAPK